MESTVVNLLESTQSPQQGPRQQAEQQLQDFYANEAFPLTLCSIASLDSLPAPIRQSALLNLKNFVLAAWSSSFEEFRGQVLVSDANKLHLRSTLLDLATNGTVERKIQNAASYVVSKIATVDYPDEWPDLLPTLLHIIAESGDARLHGALKVLAELVEDGFNEDQFFKVAQDLVNILHAVAVNDSRPPALRALAVSVFRGSFSILEMVLEDHKSEVKIFAEQTVAGWMPFFLNVLQSRLPPKPPQNDTSDTAEFYRGSVALKLQIVKALMRIRILFPKIISPQSQVLFSATWEELSSLQPEYQTTYVHDDQEGRLEDADGLPYTLDFLVLENLDFMQACIRAPPVRQALEAQLHDQSQSDWVLDVMRLAASYAQITTEEEGMWQIDVNVFLSEETSVTANYTARTACGDLVIKLGEWLPDATMRGLVAYSQRLQASDETWRPREAVLYLLNQILNDWQDDSKKVDQATSEAFHDIIQHAIASQGSVFLMARGYLVAGALTRGSHEAFYDKAMPLFERTLRAIIEDSEEIVQVSCIRAIQNYLQALPPTYTITVQPSIISTLSAWISARDMSDLTESDDLMITLLETLRDTLLLDTRICVAGDGLNLLFSIASQGASNMQVTTLVTEMFEEICTTIQALGTEAYEQLCQRVLPSLTGAFDVGDLTEQNALTNLAAELLNSLTEYSPPPLPVVYIPTVFPKLIRHTLQSTDSELLKSCTSTLRYIVSHSADQLFSWKPPPQQSSPTTGRSGLEAVLSVIDRLLNPSLVDDHAAAEVGYLAAEVVEKGGAAQLGPYMMQQLLQAVAQRLASAEQASLIQSLILVFARLTMTNASEVIDFLATLSIPNAAPAAAPTPDASQQQPSSGLQVVLSKWLENTSDFAGYDSIRLNTLALSKLFALHDPRLSQVFVKGDLVVDPATSARIVTRSRAKAMPERWTPVPVPVKIVKVLVAELALQQQQISSAAGLGIRANGSSGDGAAAHGEGGATDGDADGADGFGSADEAGDDDDSDGEWEDEPGAGLNVLDLGIGATKAELMALGGEEGEFSVRRPDDETQAFLEGFFREQAGDARFVEVFGQLNEGEREKLRGLG